MGGWVGRREGGGEKIVLGGWNGMGCGWEGIEMRE